MTVFGSSSSGEPAPEAFPTVWPPSPVAVAGPAGTESLAYNSGRSEVTWTLDGPDSHSNLVGLRTVYAPPDTVDADRVATVTARAGDLQASTGIRVLAPPFLPNPTTLSVTAADGAASIRVVPRDPTAVLPFAVDDPDVGDVRSRGNTVWYVPPADF